MELLGHDLSKPIQYGIFNDEDGLFWICLFVDMVPDMLDDPFGPFEYIEDAEEELSKLVKES